MSPKSANSVFFKEQLKVIAAVRLHEWDLLRALRCDSSKNISPARQPVLSESASCRRPRVFPGSSASERWDGVALDKETETSAG